MVTVVTQQIAGMYCITWQQWLHNKQQVCVVCTWQQWLHKHATMLTLHEELISNVLEVC